MSNTKTLPVLERSVAAFTYQLKLRPTVSLYQVRVSW
jgi:hypothetical protein